MFSMLAGNMMPGNRESFAARATTDGNDSERSRPITLVLIKRQPAAIVRARTSASNNPQDAPAAARACNPPSPALCTTLDRASEENRLLRMAPKLNVSVSPAAKTPARSSHNCVVLNPGGRSRWQVAVAAKSTAANTSVKNSVNPNDNPINSDAAASSEGSVIPTLYRSELPAPRTSTRALNDAYTPNASGV